MEIAQVMGLCRDALWLALSVALPILSAGIAVGLLIGLFQAATQIQEQTLSMAVKLVVMALAAIWFLPWMTARLVEYAQTLFEGIPESLTPFL